MEIHFTKNATLSLVDMDQFKTFKLVAAGTQSDHTLQLIDKALSDLGTLADSTHAWIDAQRLIVLSGKGGDKTWLKGFDEMISLGKKYGFTQDNPLRIRAHIEWDVTKNVI